MAQGDFYQLAVAYPVTNPKFNLPTLLTSTVAAITASTVDINNAFANTNNLVKKGDRLVVSDSTNETSENLIVESLSDPGGGDSRITLKDDTTIATTGGDVVIYATKFVGGWIRSGPSETDNVEPVTIEPFGKGLGAGRHLSYAQVLRNGSAQTTGRSMRLELDPDKLISWGYYRSGIMYKVVFWINAGSADFIRNIIADSENNQLNTVIASATDQVWKRFASAGHFMEDKDAGIVTPFLSYNIQNDDVGDEITVWYGLPFLEHAKGTTGITRVQAVSLVGGSQYDITVNDQIQNLAAGLTSVFPVTAADVVAFQDGTDATIADVDSITADATMRVTLTTGGAPGVDDEVQIKNDGYYEIPDYPIQSSIDYGMLSNQQSGVLGDNSGFMFEPMSRGDKSKRWFFRCRFVATDQDIWDALNVLLDWQRRGNLINFHPFIDDLPHVLSGAFRLENITKRTHFSLARRDFDFVFEELNI